MFFRRGVLLRPRSCRSIMQAEYEIQLIDTLYLLDSIEHHGREN